MEKRVFAIRGAAFASNTKDSIKKAAVEVFNEAAKSNSLSCEDIVCVQFTLTRDLDAANPASALREGDAVLDVSSAPLFCCQEAFVQGGREGVVRLLLTAYLQKPPVHAYVGDAKILRPDFAK